MFIYSYSIKKVLIRVKIKAKIVQIKNHDNTPFRMKKNPNYKQKPNKGLND